MRRFIAFTAALLIGVPAYADTIFTGTFSGDQETVDTGSPGTGDAIVTLSTDGLSLTVDFDFSGMVSPTVDSHIHCCAPLGDDPTVNNGPVAVGFTPVGFPLGVTSGSFTHTFDLTDAGIYNPPFVEANGGTTDSARAALVAGLEAGLAYLNIHSQQFPPGEIRAQLNEAAVPEPAAIGLIGLGVLGLGLRRKRSALLTR